MKLGLPILFAFLLQACDGATDERKEETMFEGKEKKYVIFSPMKGTLLKDGKPLANTTITRTLRWNGNDDEGLKEEFQTNEIGEFTLPIHEEILTKSPLSQFVSKSQLQVNIDDTAIDVWYSSKFNGDLHSETDGQITGLTCDLNSDELYVTPGTSTVVTLCRWGNMPQPEQD